jgi:hypothetical protein
MLANTMTGQRVKPVIGFIGASMFIHFLLTKHKLNSINKKIKTDEPLRDTAQRILGETWNYLTYYLPFRSKNNNIISIDSNETLIIKYEDKYIERFEKLICNHPSYFDESLNNSFNKFNSCFVMEYTPYGSILMQYDTNKRNFSYYSNSSVPTKILYAVAMKFILSFNAKYIIYRPDKNTDNSEDENSEKEQKEKKKGLYNHKSSVFAKFKTINGGVSDTKNEQENKAQEKKAQEDVKKESADIQALKKIRFVKQGRFADSTIFKSQQNKTFKRLNCELENNNTNKIKENSDFTFADYKRMMIQNKI